MPIKFKTKFKRATTAAKVQSKGPDYPTVGKPSAKRDVYAKVKQARTFKVKPPRYSAAAARTPSKQLASL